MQDRWIPLRVEYTTAPWGYIRDASGLYFVPNMEVLSVLSSAFDLAETGLSLRKASKYVTTVSGKAISHQGLKDVYEVKRGRLRDAIINNAEGRKHRKYDASGYYTTEGVIYAICNPAWPDWIKIGMANDVEERCGSYQTSSPFRDYYIAHHADVHNKRVAERKLHKQLEKIAFDRRGEWFKIPVPIAVTCISELLKQQNSPQ